MCLVAGLAFASFSLLSVAADDVGSRLALFLALVSVEICVNTVCAMYTALFAHSFFPRAAARLTDALLSHSQHEHNSDARLVRVPQRTFTRTALDTLRFHLGSIVFNSLFTVR